MVFSGGRHHNQRRGHCVGRIPGPSTGKGTGSAERSSDHVQECGFEEEIHH
jgi:hypothetical protein